MMAAMFVSYIIHCNQDISLIVDITTSTYQFYCMVVESINVSININVHKWLQCPLVYHLFILINWIHNMITIFVFYWTNIHGYNDHIIVDVVVTMAILYVRLFMLILSVIKLIHKILNIHYKCVLGLVHRYSFYLGILCLDCISFYFLIYN